MEPETLASHSAAFKAKIEIKALTDSKTIAGIAQKHGVYPNRWGNGGGDSSNVPQERLAARWRPRHRRRKSRPCMPTSGSGGWRTSDDHPIPKRRASLAAA
jgi:hypothetical protein